ncbi:MAG: prolipoprotein diacylglyceryl transferase [Anaerolineae bacterium]|nr:prolipoprotein diacylglyceryl transferase [Anaerolineae bacterium]
MQPMLHIGPAAIQTAVLLWVLGLWMGIEGAALAGRRVGLPQGFVERATWRALLAAVIVGRVAFVVQYPAGYRHDALSLLSPQPETLDGRAGLFAGALIMLWMARRAQVRWRPLLDAFAPGVGIVLAAVAVAQLMDGVHLGLASDVPWAVTVWDVARHPVQLYIAGPVLAVAAGVVFWPKPRPFVGFDALVVGGVYALAVLISSRWCEASVTVGDDFRREQVIAWLALVLIALLGGWWSYRAQRRGGRTVSTPSGGG